MNISVYIPTGNILVGGGEVVPLMQAQFLSRMGHTVTVLCISSKVTTDFFKNFHQNNPNISYVFLKPAYDGFEDLSQTTIDHRMTHELYFALSRPLSSYLNINAPDVILTHYAPAGISVPSTIKQALFLHGVPSEIQTVNVSGFKSADARIAVSNSVADGWTEQTGQKPEIVIHNGIDVTQYYPIIGTQKDIDVLYVGRHIEIKGIQYIIKAANLLKEQGTQVHISIAGKGPYTEYLKNLTSSLGLDSSIVFLGYVDEKELNTLYNRSKIAIFPSYAKEGVLTTMLEAAAAKSALITSNCCGMIDFAKDTVNACLVKPQDEKDIAGKIQLLLSNPSLRERLSKQAYQDIHDNWTWEDSVSRLDSFLQTII
jgi:glycosyltransferase involved in cell wall biosynthesis